jgi:uroporphyrinogen-III synthase
MSGLSGKRIAVLQARRSAELAALIRRHGGEPVIAPAVREHPLPSAPEVGLLIDGLVARSIQIVVFLTGAGVGALFQEAERLGRQPELLATLQAATTVCRGPKPTAELVRRQISPSVRTPEPYTIAALMRSLDEFDVAGLHVAVVHYGEREPVFASGLRKRGAIVTELCLYEWLLPDDVAPLRTLIHDILDGKVDAIAFTSQVQARHLFQVAMDLGKEAQLVQVLNTQMVVASLAPVCATTLRRLGVEPHVVPQHSKMGHLVLALAAYLRGLTDRC